MSMLGRINTTFGTYQADLFESGLVAQICPNSFPVWAAIKAHADFQTGIAWPSVRRLMALTGLASATVQKCIGTLEDAHLLRSDVRNKRRYYVARERLECVRKLARFVPQAALERGRVPRLVGAKVPDPQADIGGFGRCEDGLRMRLVGHR